MARTRYQEPKLHWDARQERWEVRYRVDELDTTTGVTHRIRKKAFFPKSEYPTSKLAKAALAEILEPINSRTYRPSRILTFAAFADSWIKNTLAHYKPSTRNSSQNHIEKHLKPALGKLQLRDITPEVLQAWVTRLTHAGEIGPKTIANIFRTLGMLWNSPGGAKPLGHVQHNPCTGIKLPVVGDAVTYCYSEEEINAICFAFAGKGQDHLVVRLIGENGMRPGEIPALQISSLDFEALEIHITKAATHNQLHSPKGKGKGKLRTLTMSNLMAQDLQAHLKGRTEGLVFEGHKPGSLYDIKNFVSKDLYKVLGDLGIRAKAQKMGIARLGLYPARHGVNTDMANNGVNSKTRMLQLGHSKEKTNDIYNHGDEEAIRAWQNARAQALAAPAQGAIQ